MRRKYPEFEALVGELKRSAIDAWVTDKAGPFSVKIDNDKYVVDLVVAGEYIRYEVSRPGVNGQGGGICLSEGGYLPKDVNAAAFERIRSTIEEIVDPWRDLPRPDHIDPVVSKCRSASMDLSGTGTGTGTDGTPAELPALLDSIRDSCDKMSGSTITAFQNKFVRRLSGVIGACWAISAIRCQAVAAQKKLWLESRQAVASTLDEARKAFDRIANHHKKADWRIGLDIIGWLSAGIKTVAAACPPAAIGAGITSLTVSIAQTTLGKAEWAEDSPGSYDDALAALKSTLNELNRRIKSAERLIANNINKNLSIIDENKDHFDLTLVPIRPGGEDEVKIIDQGLVNGVVTRSMPDLATLLEDVANMTESCDPYSALARDASIGMGSHGPSSSIREISDLLERMLKDLSWEVRNGAQNLMAAYFFEQEERTANELNKIADKIEAGNDYSPLDPRIWDATQRLLGDLSYMNDRDQPAATGTDATG